MNAHRLAVGQAQAPEPHDLSAFGDPQFFGHVGFGFDDVLLEHFGRGVETAAPHFVGEAGHLARPLRQLRFGDECAAPLFAPDVTELREVVQGVTNGNLADVKPRDQVVLGRQTLARTPASRLDVVEEGCLELVIQRNRRAALER